MKRTMMMMMMRMSRLAGKLMMRPVERGLARTHQVERTANWWLMECIWAYSVLLRRLWWCRREFGRRVKRT
jgi:hypothetical protein